MGDSAATSMLNTDAGVHVRIESERLPWQPAHMPGFTWKLFEHNGMSPARYTAILHWPAGLPLERHVHDNGEEILVLDGTFFDEAGEYGSGTYLRNPHDSTHMPGTREGCTMLVKMRQMGAGDQRRVAIDTTRAEWLPTAREGMSVMPFYRHGGESASMIRMARGFSHYLHRHVGGEEVFVVSGSFSDEYGHHPRGTWLRYPVISSHEPASEEGCVLFVKQGHLSSPWRLIHPVLRRI